MLIVFELQTVQSYQALLDHLSNTNYEGYNLGYLYDPNSNKYLVVSDAENIYQIQRLNFAWLRASEYPHICNSDGYSPQGYVTFARPIDMLEYMSRMSGRQKLSCRLTRSIHMSDI